MKKKLYRNTSERENENELTNDINECSARYDFSMADVEGKKKKEKEKMPSVFVFFFLSSSSISNTSLTHINNVVSCCRVRSLSFFSFALY